MVINWIKPFRILLISYFFLNILFSRHIVADSIIAVLLIVIAVLTLQKIKYIRQLSLRLFNNTNSLIILNECNNDMNILKRFLVINPSGIVYKTEVDKEGSIFDRIFRKEYKQVSFTSDQISTIAVQNDEILIYLPDSNILFFKDIKLSKKAFNLLTSMDYDIWRNGVQMYQKEIQV